MFAFASGSFYYPFSSYCLGTKKCNLLMPLFVVVLKFDHAIREANGISQWASVASYKNKKFELSG